MIVFLDTSALIYLVEAKEPFATAARHQLSNATKKRPDTRVGLSRLTWLECRVRPMKSNDAAALSAYDAFFEKPDLAWVELTKNVVELAAAIRARHGLRTPDALQAACCLQLGNDHLFLTGDREFARVGGLHVKILS